MHTAVTTDVHKAPNKPAAIKMGTLDPFSRIKAKESAKVDDDSSKDGAKDDAGAAKKP